jgi:hypothetical protein
VATEVVTVTADLLCEEAAEQAAVIESMPMARAALQRAARGVKALALLPEGWVVAREPVDRLPTRDRGMRFFAIDDDAVVQAEAYRYTSPIRGSYVVESELKNGMAPEDALAQAVVTVLAALDAEGR